jgi:hypothetical protein
MISDLPTNSLLVIRVLKNVPTFTDEVSTMVAGLIARSAKKVERS